MGKITRALKKAAEERMERLDRIVKVTEQDHMVVRKTTDSNLDSRLVAYFDPKSVISEQYKILTTNLLSLNKSRPPRVIAVTSSIHSEGKTLTALNLAITMAQAIQKPKILLIDADMRKGRLCKYLGCTHEKGLSELLTGEAPIEETLFNVDMDNLAFISSGRVPPNPAELLASDKMKDLITNLQGQFDFIIIDTPPVIPVTDPVIIGSMVDGVLLVIQSGRTQRGMVRRASELLEQAHAKLLGHVMTGIEYFVPEYIYRYL